ncbi:MAG TPA: phosphate ABC transporter permease PstA [Cellvibrionaceae bacterium]|nr:phosphate ABC transporter permease PstA [Cellvibrionaceae bacterium]HNG58902.1 phosphate ABC transporter permease PstA [Cellvibrionaceae bacterium]
MNNSPSKQAQLVAKSLAKRYSAERRFKIYGVVSIAVGLLALLCLFIGIISSGIGGFTQTKIRLQLELNAEELQITNPKDPEQIKAADFQPVVRKALSERFPEVEGREAKRSLYSMLSMGAPAEVQAKVIANPSLLGSGIEMWLTADDDVDTYYKSIGGKTFTDRLSEKEIAWLQDLITKGELKRHFNWSFFTSGDSAEPEMAGILGTLLGSIFTLSVTLALAFPIGVAAAIYLEEYAPRNKFTDFIEVNINNLAAVPSVIFGLLGLAIFINLFHLPRSVPLVGGLVLTLITLPTIIISSRAAIKSVPPSIREAALGIGASKMQMILHHVLPLAMPGMLTGAIIGMAHALGETAPLLMIGMVAFIMDTPGGVMSPATVLPVQIFLWSDSPERAFVEKTSAAIMVLLVFLICMNTLAVWLRKRLERRW